MTYPYPYWYGADLGLYTPLGITVRSGRIPQGVYLGVSIMTVMRTLGTLASTPVLEPTPVAQVC